MKINGLHLAFKLMMLTSGHIAIADTNSDIEIVLSWAESEYATLFPSAASTESNGIWRYRFYPTTNNYTGVNSSNEVYVQGDSFGDLTYVGTLTEFLYIAVDRNSDIEAVFNWAESSYSELFPSEITTQSDDNWRFRYYPSTNNYVRVNSSDEVYVEGDDFNGLTRVGTLAEFLAQVNSEQEGGSVDIFDSILTRRSGDCAEYSEDYVASVLDISRSVGFDMSVNITIGDNVCTLTSNSIPNHNFNDMSASFASVVMEIDRSFSLARLPQWAATPTALSQQSYDAVMLNGVVLDLLSAGCYKPSESIADVNGNVPIGCNVNTDDWLLDPLAETNQFGTDIHNAHTQPDGTYHYHGNPIALFDDFPGPEGSPVIGFAADGFPIYGSYFFDGDSGAVRKAVSGYTLKAGSRGLKSEVNPGGDYDGSYIDDWEFTNGGDLDECNGMTVDAQYGYYVTDSYPWVLGCLKGEVSSSFRKN